MENSITLNGVKYEYVIYGTCHCDDCDLFIECQSLDAESTLCDIFDFITMSNGYFKKTRINYGK